MLDYNLLSGIVRTFVFFGGFGGIIALIMLGAYTLLRLASRPTASVMSHYALSQEKKAVSRLLPPDSREDLLRGIKNEEQLAGLMKNIATKNGWKSEDVRNLPAWLLTGHLVMDANPNLPSEYSKHSNDYPETDID